MIKIFNLYRPILFLNYLSQCTIKKDQEFREYSEYKRVSLYWKIRYNLTRKGSLTLACGQTEITKLMTTTDNLVMLQ